MNFYLYYGISGATFISKPRHNKLHFHNSFVNTCNNHNNETVLIGDSIFANFGKYRDIWNKFFNKTLNLSVGGNRIEHALWRVSNGGLPRSASHVVILIGTNNLQRDCPSAIAEGIRNLVMVVKSKCQTPKCTVLGLLPRGKPNSTERDRATATNKILSSYNDFYFVEPSNGWLNGSHVNANLYWKDEVHLIREGYILLTRTIVAELNFRDENQGVIGKADTFTIGGFNSYKPFPMTSCPTEELPQTEYDNDFPPLPPPRFVTVSRHINHPVFRTNPRPVLSSPISVPRVLPVRKPVSMSVCKSVSKSNRTAPQPVTHPVSSTPPVSCNVSVCKPVRPSYSHIQPLRRLNKVKPPKWEKCDYVHVPSSPVPASFCVNRPHKASCKSSCKSSR